MFNFELADESIRLSNREILIECFALILLSQGSVVLENALVRAELVRGGLVRSLVHKASGRYYRELLCKDT